MQDYEYLLSSLEKVKGIGKKTANLFKKKDINNIFDLLWELPISKIETSEETDVKNLKLGKTQTVKVIPIKYNFPRIRNLPNKVICKNYNDEIDCVFFNSYEGYIKKILPLEKEIILSKSESPLVEDFLNDLEKLKNYKRYVKRIYIKGK